VSGLPPAASRGTYALPPIPALAPSAALAIDALAAPSAAQAQGPRFYITNMTGMTITHVYVSSVPRSDWGHDLLGNQVLGAGQRVFLSPPTCVNDIRATCAGGRHQESCGLDVCRVTNFNIR